jgi:hypothetical protein
VATDRIDDALAVLAVVLAEPEPAAMRGVVERVAIEGAPDAGDVRSCEYFAASSLLDCLIMRPSSCRVAASVSSGCGCASNHPSRIAIFGTLAA